jgi:hypothetical protein
VLLIAARICASSLAAAAPKNPAATKLANDAMFRDYLSLRFVDAHNKLERAVKMCGRDECSPRVMARLHRDLGVVLIAGFNDAGSGRSEFAQALKFDPSIGLDKDLTTPEIEKAFRVAGGAPTGVPKSNTPPEGDAAPARSAPASRAPDEGVLHTPPAEQATMTPVPIYVELEVDSEKAKVVVQYKPFGVPEWKKLDLRRTEGGFGGEIPCREVGSTTGDLLYYLYVLDGAGDLTAKSASRAAPHRVAIRNRISGPAPHLPGQPAPSRCSEVSDCPPDFPGCLRGKSTSVRSEDRANGGEKPSRGNKTALGKVWGDGCSTDSECGPGLACKAGQCDTGAKAEADEAESPGGGACETNADCPHGETCGSDGACAAPGIPLKRFWLNAHVAQDVSMVGSMSNVCGAAGDAAPSNVLCLSGGGDAYTGVAQPGEPGDGNGNAIRGGPHVGTTRLLAGVDYLVGANVMLGARIGWAFHSAPRDGLPLHLEGRASYFLGRDPFRRTAVREYLAFVGGRAEIDDKYDVQVREATSAQSSTQDLVVYRAAGKYFAGAAAGLMLPLGAKQAIVAEMKFIASFPTQGFAISPSVGYAF